MVTIRERLMGSTLGGGKNVWKFLCADREGNIDPAAGGFVLDGSSLAGGLYNKLLKGAVNVTGRVRGTEKLPIKAGDSSRVATVPFLAEAKIEIPK